MKLELKHKKIKPMISYSSPAMDSTGFGHRQAIDKRKMALWSTIFSTFDENNLVNFGPLAKNDLDLWPWDSIGFVPSSRYMFVQSIIKLSAAVYELSCAQRKKVGRKQYSPSLPRAARTVKNRILPRAESQSQDRLVCNSYSLAVVIIIKTRNGGQSPTCSRPAL